VYGIGQLMRLKHDADAQAKRFRDGHRQNVHHLFITFSDGIEQISNKDCIFAAFIFFEHIINLMENKKNTELLRKNKKAILFNNRELKAIESYCLKYGIHNRSKFMREAIITSILKKFEDDYPTLF
jgi:hypothetical protein